MSIDLSALSDGELAALSLGGREAAFGEIMRRHRVSMYRLIFGNIADADEALDLVQESFVSAYGALARYDQARPMRSWLAAIALNKCRDWHRRRAVRRLFVFALPLDARSADVPDDQAPPDVALADREEVRRVALAVAALPTTLREPLVLRSVQDLSQGETAAILGISEKAVETRVRRARAKLSELLKRS